MERLAKCVCNYFREIERLFKTRDDIDPKKLQKIWNLDQGK